METKRRNDGTTNYSVNTAAQKVTVTHITAHTSLPDSDGYLYTTTLDFSQCSEAEILTMAAKHAIIEFRNHKALRKCDKPEEFENYEQDVAKMLRAARKGSKPSLEKTTKAANKLTDEQAAELLKILQARLEK